MQNTKDRNLFLSISENSDDRNGKHLHVFTPNEHKLNASLERFFDLFAIRIPEFYRYLEAPRAPPRALKKAPTKPEIEEQDNTQTSVEDVAKNHQLVE